MPTPTEENAKKIAELEKDRGLTNHRVDTVEKATEKLQEIASGHTPEIAELQAEVKQLKSDRDDLRRQLDGLKTQLLAAAITVILCLVGVVVTISIAFVNKK